MVDILKQSLPDATVSATSFVMGRSLTVAELRKLIAAGIEVSAPIVNYVGMLLETEYTYYFQAVHSCV